MLTPVENSGYPALRAEIGALRAAAGLLTPFDDIDPVDQAYWVQRVAELHPAEVPTEVPVDV